MNRVSRQRTAIGVKHRRHLLSRIDISRGLSNTSGPLEIGTAGLSWVICSEDSPVRPVNSGCPKCRGLLTHHDNSAGYPSFYTEMGMDMQLEASQRLAMVKALISSDMSALDALRRYIAVGEKSMGQFCGAIGIARSYINQVSYGRHKLSTRCMSAIEEQTGIDFWTLEAQHKKSSFYGAQISKQNQAMAKALIESGVCAFEVLQCHVACNSKTMGEFCAAIGKSRNYFSHVSEGKYPLSPETQKRIITLTGIDFWTLETRYQQAPMRQKR